MAKASTLAPVAPHPPEPPTKVVPPYVKYQTDMRLVASLEKEYQRARQEVQQLERAREGAIVELMRSRDEFEKFLLKDKSDDESDDQ